MLKALATRSLISITAISGELCGDAFLFNRNCTSESPPSRPLQSRPLHRPWTKVGFIPHCRRARHTSAWSLKKARRENPCQMMPTYCLQQIIAIS